MRPMHALRKPALYAGPNLPNHTISVTEPVHPVPNAQNRGPNYPEFVRLALVAHETAATRREGQLRILLWGLRYRQRNRVSFL